MKCKLFLQSIVYSKEYEKSLLQNFSYGKVVFVRNMLEHLEKAVWRWYKVMHGATGFSFGL